MEIKDDEKTGDKSKVDAIQYTDDVKKGYVPEGFATVEEFLEDMRGEYASDLDFDRQNRVEAIADKKFAAGEQWDPVVLEHRKGLPTLVINTVPQFTAQLVGDWRQNRNAIKVIPSDDGDVDIANVREDLVRAIEMKSRADRVYDSAFESTVQCGDGVFRIAVEYSRDDVFDQDIFIRPIDDALAVVWDRMSIDPTGRDARHVFVDDVIPTTEFKRKWPEASPSNLGENMQETLRTEGWWTEAGVKVTEYWRMIERQRLLCLFENGKTVFMDGADMDAVIKENGSPVKTRMATCLYAQMHLVSGSAILSGPHEYRINRVPIIRMMGRVVNIAGRRVRYGLVRFMKDPVRLRNFWRSVAAEQLGYAPKAQWMATESAVEGREELLRKAHLSRDPLLIFNDEAQFGQNVQRVDPPQMQMALLNEAQVNTQDMKDVTGIHDASLGIKSNETSGKAIMARQREGDVASITFHDNGSAALQEAGDVINQLIPQIYDGTRVLRVIGKDEEPRFVRINDSMDPKAVDMSVGNYDVVLTSGVSYTTRRVEAAEAMMQAIQVAPELMQIAGDLIVKAQDWPGADKLAERLKRTIPPQLLGPDEQGGAAPGGIDPRVAQQAAQEAQQKLVELQQENIQLKQQYDLKSREVAIKEHELKLKVYDSETLRIKALSDNQVDGTQLEQDAIKTILEHSRNLDEQDIKRETLKAKPALSSSTRSETPSTPGASSSSGKKSQ